MKTYSFGDEKIIYFMFFNYIWLMISISYIEN